MVIEKCTISLYGNVILYNNNNNYLSLNNDLWFDAILNTKSTKKNVIQDNNSDYLLFIIHVKFIACCKNK